MHEATVPTPTPADAIRIVEGTLGKKVAAIRRFPTGLAHYVYDISTTDNQLLVARLTRPADRDAFSGAVYWYHRLKPLAVPLPQLFAFSLDENSYGFPYMLMERFPGNDLGDIYPQLTLDQKRDLAHEIVALQGRVAQLPQALGYGYARSYEDPSLKKTWRAVLNGQLERSRQRIATAQIFPSAFVDEVYSFLQTIDTYLANIAPKAFLDDTTTKNVLVHNGKLSGIVDVDYVCFGDPLLTVGLTQMALLSARQDTDYISYWTATLNLNALQHRALQIYTATFCLDFMSELGQQFNRDHVAEIDPQRVDQLNRIFRFLKDSLAQER